MSMLLIKDAKDLDGAVVAALSKLKEERDSAVRIAEGHRKQVESLRNQLNSKTPHDKEVMRIKVDRYFAKGAAKDAMTEASRLAKENRVLKTELGKALASKEPVVVRDSSIEEEIQSLKAQVLYLQSELAQYELTHSANRELKIALGAERKLVQDLSTLITWDKVQVVDDGIKRYPVTLWGEAGKVSMKSGDTIKVVESPGENLKKSIANAVKSLKKPCVIEAKGSMRAFMADPLVEKAVKYGNHTWF